MRKPVATMGLCLLMCLSCLPALGKTAFAQGAPMETDSDLFALCLVAAGWDVPAGYALEGFCRADLNADGVTDAAASLRRDDENERLLVVFLSGSEGYTVLKNGRALPSSADGSGWGDLFQGLEAGPEGIRIYARDGEEGEYLSQYVFTWEGQRLLLSGRRRVRWDEGRGVEAFAAAEPEAEEARRLALEDFDVEQFSTTEEKPAQAGMIRCPRCMGWFADEAAVRAHVCGGTPSEPEMIFCSACGQWYAQGEAFQTHTCAPQPGPIWCEACGSWFGTEDDFLSHTCVSYEDVNAQFCEVCGGWFEDSAALRVHLCVSYPDSARMYCDVCGGFFDEGEAFRNHLCGP